MKLSPLTATVDTRGQCAGLWRVCVCVCMCCGKSRTWWGGRGDEEEGHIHCLLMRAFDVAPLFAVCTPGPLRLHSDWLSGGGVVGGWATRYFPGNTFQSAAAAAWRGKAVKAARPLCLPPSSLRCILPHPSYSIVLPGLQTSQADTGCLAGVPLDTRRGWPACQGSQAMVVPSSGAGNECCLTAAAKQGISRDTGREVGKVGKSL